MRRAVVVFAILIAATACGPRPLQTGGRPNAGTTPTGTARASSSVTGTTGATETKPGQATTTVRPSAGPSWP